MVCDFIKCVSNRVDDRLIPCFLCDSVYHLKCCGITGKCLDSMNNNTGFFYVCLNCRNLNVDIIKDFRNARKAFADISSDLLCLQNKLSRYESLFSSVESVINKNVSVSAKEKVDIATSKTKQIEEVATSKKSLANLAKAQSYYSLDSDGGSPSSKSQRTTSLFSPSHDDNRNVNVSSGKTSSDNFNVKSPNAKPPSAKKIDKRSTLAKTPSYKDILTGSAVTNKSLKSPLPNIANSSSCSVSASETLTKKTLQAVEVVKHIFVSRLKPDTSESDVIQYIKTTINTEDSEVLVRKLLPHVSRPIASFKVTIPERLMNSISNPQFWPSGALVHEFKVDRKAQRNPVSLISSKNSKTPVRS